MANCVGAFRVSFSRGECVQFLLDVRRALAAVSEANVATKTSDFGSGLGNLGFASAMANVSKCLLMLRRSFATVSEANVAKKVTKADIRKSKTKNLFEVAKLLPNGGVGSKMAKTHWRPGSFYKVTEIKLYKAEGHGMAWGIYHQEGIEPGKLQKIGGANRRCWQHITEEAAQPSSTVEEEPQMNVNA